MWERDRLLAINLEKENINRWLKTIKLSKHKNKDKLIEIQKERKEAFKKEGKELEKIFKEKCSIKAKMINKKLSSS